MLALSLYCEDGIGSTSGFRTDTNPLADAGNLFVDVAVVAGAVWALRTVM